MSHKTQRVQLGYVCPEWAKAYWNPEECEILNCTDETFAIVDMELHGVTVYVGQTRQQCSEWLRKYSYGV